MGKEHASIFGDETTLVAGAPHHFNLTKAIHQADEVWIASAFVRKSGWNLVRRPLLASRARVILLCGLDFCQSEPAVLKDWNGKELNERKAEAYIYTGPETFHPKVFLVRSGKREFALVGSGNLSAGGLGENIECFAYVKDREALRQIRRWLCGILANRLTCVPISSFDVRTYESKWEKTKGLQDRLRGQSADALAKIREDRTAHMKKWGEAVSKAKRFFKTSFFKKWHKEHQHAAKNVLESLRYPSFKFGFEDWRHFYSIRNMGQLSHLNMRPAFKQGTRLRKGLRILAKKEKPAYERIDAVLDQGSADYVERLGINAATKIMASIEPKRWPVYNGPVKDALDLFGYRGPSGVGPGRKYEAFADLMQTFREETGASDMLALDCFFCKTGKGW